MRMRGKGGIARLNPLGLVDRQQFVPITRAEFSVPLAIGGFGTVIWRECGHQARGLATLLNPNQAEDAHPQAKMG